MGYGCIREVNGDKRIKIVVMKQYGKVQNGRQGRRSECNKSRRNLGKIKVMSIQVKTSLA
jgi:hypothetical protein